MYRGKMQIVLFIPLRLLFSYLAIGLNTLSVGFP